jgi:hypothetical protein
MTRPADTTLRRVRPVGTITLALFMPALLGQAASAPSGGETVGERLAELVRVPAKQRSSKDIAEQLALEFCAAIGEADGARLESLVYVVGYQPLPLAGELPDPPHRPIPPAALAKRVGARQKAGVLSVEMARFALKPPVDVREPFPAIARWMASDDWALIVHPIGIAGWPTESRCIVIRVRGGRAAVIGGNLID